MSKCYLGTKRYYYKYIEGGGVEESTEDDYDFYLDKPIALLNKNEDNNFIAYKY